MQHSMKLIEHEVQGSPVQQRAQDGYINATAMCRVAGKRWPDYWRLGTSRDFVKELSSVVHICTTDLVQTQSGGDPRLQGTWVHPQVAIHLAQWLSPAFSVRVSQWVYDWMSGKGTAQSAQSYHLRRYASNLQNVPFGHWSMLQEMMVRLIGPMEVRGYVLPENLLPDISQGKMYCKFLRDELNVDTNSLPKYIHEFEDGRRVKANAYPNSLWPAFIEHFHTVWLPNKSEQYFGKRDPKALEYLPYLLPKPDAA